MSDHSQERRLKEKAPKTITVVLPMRNRSGPLVRNCLKGLAHQTVKPDIIIADYGSTGKMVTEMVILLKEFEGKIREPTFIHHSTDKEWSLSRARNMGIRRSKTMFTAVLDVDMILEPDVINRTLEVMKTVKNAYLSSKVRMHGPGFDYSYLELPRDFEKLRRIPLIGHVQGMSQGSGGYIAASTEWLQKVRGFDERMVFWGAEDDDLAVRAERDGLSVLAYRKGLQWFNFPWTGIHHQYHEDSLSLMDFFDHLTDRQRAMIANNRRIYSTDESIVRNDENWGVWHEFLPVHEGIE